MLKIWEFLPGIQGLGPHSHGFLHNGAVRNGFTLKWDWYRGEFEDRVTWEDESYTLDHDGDGFSVPEDCNDFYADIYPGAPSLKRGMDDDCNGYIDADERIDTTSRRLSVKDTFYSKDLLMKYISNK